MTCAHRPWPPPSKHGALATGSGHNLVGHGTSAAFDLLFCGLLEGEEELLPPAGLDHLAGGDVVEDRPAGSS